MNREMFDLVDDYCEHGNVPEDCGERCGYCDHACWHHEEEQCTGNVNGFSGDGSPVDGECDCDGFQD